MSSRDSSVANALRQLARRQGIKQLILESPLAYAVLLRAATRFVAGEERSAAIARVRDYAARGWKSTVDFAGENTTSAEQAHAATKEFLALIRDVAKVHGGSVSFDLSHVGLSIAREMAHENAARMAHVATECGVERMISMEDSAKTDAVLEAHAALARESRTVGITLQACMRRTEEDLKSALNRPGRIRLVKGAFLEPATLALSRSMDIDVAYRQHMRVLIESGHSCSIATHDERILEEAFRIQDTSGNDLVEYEFLDGAAPHLTERVRSAGRSARVYIVYGREWYLYLLHRLAENTDNVLGYLVDLVAALPPAENIDLSSTARS